MRTGTYVLSVLLALLIGLGLGAVAGAQPSVVSSPEAASASTPPQSPAASSLGAVGSAQPSTEYRNFDRVETGDCFDEINDSSTGAGFAGPRPT